MIAKVCKPGSDPHRLIHYLERTSRDGSRMMDHNLGGSTAKEWARELRMVNDAYRKQKTLFVKHLVLSFPRGEHASDDEMRAMVRHFLDHMGYEETPFVALLHTNTANDHIHIVTTPTSWAGEKVSESHERWRSVRAAREIEEKWNLQRVANPEGAFVKSPTQGEMKKAARTQAPPERARFQVEIGAIAKEAKNLVEFLRKARDKGFQARVALDSAGELKGISFSQNGVAFKGSQLGRAFRGQRLLSMFGLRYNPTTELEEVRRLTAPKVTEPTKRLLSDRLLDPLKRFGDRFVGKGEARTEEQILDSLRLRETLAADLLRLQAHPELPARELQTLASLREEPRLPTGSYRVALIRPPSDGKAMRDMERFHIEWQRFALTAEDVRKLTESLATDPKGLQMLVREESSGKTSLAFRNLDREQVSALRRDGFEPRLLVQVGERFDVLLRTGEHLDTAVAGRLRQEIAARHGIQIQRGLWADGVRLPGSRVEIEGQLVQTRLIEVREEPFSGAAELTDPTRLKLHSQLEELTRRVSTPALPSGPISAAHEVENLPVLRFPGNHPIGRLHSEVRDFARRREPPLGSTLPAGSPDALLGALRIANRDAIREALEAYPRLKGAFPARERLKVLEGDLSAAIQDARRNLDPALARYEQASKTAESLATKVSPTGSAEAVRRYQAAALAYGKALDELETCDAAYSRLVLTRARLDRERFGAYALGGDRDSLAEYRARLSAEVRLAARVGEPLPDPLSGSLRARELGERLHDINHQLARLEVSPATLAERQDLWRERAWGDLLLDRARARVSGSTSIDLAPSAVGETQLAHLDRFVQWRSDLSARAQVEQATAALVANAPERIRQASARVAAGDLSPEALRRLNAALLTDPHCQRVTLPILRPVDDPRQNLSDLSRLLGAVQRDAVRETIGSPSSATDRAHLLASSTEAVARIAQLDALHRSRLGLQLSTPAPPGRTSTEWTTAWLLHVQQRGLALPLAQSHLEAASRVPEPGSLRVPERMAILAAVEGLRLVKGWAKRLERELHR